MKSKRLKVIIFSSEIFRNHCVECSTLVKLFEKENFQIKNDFVQIIKELELELTQSKNECKILQNENYNLKSTIKEKDEQAKIEKFEYEKFVKYYNVNMKKEIDEQKQILKIENEINQPEIVNQMKIVTPNLFDQDEKAVQNKSETHNLKSNQSEKSRIPIGSVNILKRKRSSDNGNIPLVAVKPMGFKNPKGYCYLNCVVQVLASCDDFKKDIETWDCGKYFDETDDSIFVKGLFNLINALRNSDSNLLNDSLNIIQNYISESSFGDDVYKCFMNILSRVSKVIKLDSENPNARTNPPITATEKSQINFEKFKNKKPGLVFDNFYGQLTFQMICDSCQSICNESFQVIKSMTLAVPISKTPITLEDCVNLFFSESPVKVEKSSKSILQKKPKSPKLKSRIRLTHGPKYLFIYLNRGSYTDNGAKIDTFVTCVSKTINIEVYSNSPINYKLISVIDHVGNTFYGHYYCKSNFEGSQWWLLNDELVKECSNDVVTKDTVVFLFKRNHGPIEF